MYVANLNKNIVPFLCLGSKSYDALGGFLECFHYQTVYVTSLFQNISEIFQLLSQRVQSSAKSLDLHPAEHDSEKGNNNDTNMSGFSLSSEIAVLCLIEQNIDANAISVLETMGLESNLCHLTELTFTRCTGLKATVGRLFTSHLPLLRQLCLYRCRLVDRDYVHLSNAMSCNKLPLLDSIVLPVCNVKDGDEVLAIHLVKQSCLYLINVFLM